MKTTFRLIGLIAIAIIGLAFFGCKEEPDSTTKLCICNPKAHLGIGETCNCGKEDCTSCTLQVYGNVGGVNIYRKGAVTDFTTADDITEAVANVQAAYNMPWPVGDKSLLATKVGKIIIIPGTITNKTEEDGKWNIEIGAEIPDGGIAMILGSNTVS